MDNNSTAAAGIVGVAMLVYGIVMLALLVFFIWVYWRIFDKAGMNGALSLLNLIPGIGTLICVLLLAFSVWPLEQEVAALRAGHPQPPIGGSGIGGPPMTQGS